jgi:hypothetical protein
MPLEIISQRINSATTTKDMRNLQILLNGLIDAIRVVTLKLDADATVTDTNYTAQFDANIKK